MVSDPRLQLRHVNGKRALHPRADEVDRTEPAFAQHACDLRLGLLATRAPMRGRYRREFLIRHDRPPAHGHTAGLSTCSWFRDLRTSVILGDFGVVQELRSGTDRLGVPPRQ